MIAVRVFVPALLLNFVLFVNGKSFTFPPETNDLNDIHDDAFYTDLDGEDALYRKPPFNLGVNDTDSGHHNDDGSVGGGYILNDVTVAPDDLFNQGSGDEDCYESSGDNRDSDNTNEYDSHSNATMQPFLPTDYLPDNYDNSNDTTGGGGGGDGAELFDDEMEWDPYDGDVYRWNFAGGVTGAGKSVLAKKQKTLTGNKTIIQFDAVKFSGVSAKIVYLLPKMHGIDIGHDADSGWTVEIRHSEGLKGVVYVNAYGKR